MYLLHMFILPTAVSFFKPHTPTPLCIILAALATFAASAIAAIALRRIPKLGELIGAS